jgi:hypothetical protein
MFFLRTRETPTHSSCTETSLLDHCPTLCPTKISRSPLICCKTPACQAFSSSPSVPIPRTSQACRSLRQDLSVLRNIAYGRHDTLNVYHLSSSMCSLSNRGLDFQLVQQRTNESKSHYQVANTSEISMYVLHMPMVDGELHSIDRAAVDA